MMMKEKKERLKEIPLKNYIYLFFILLISILIIIYAYTWYQTYNKSKLNTNVIADYLTIINYNELDNYIIENKDAVIYVSILGNEDINRFEKKFKTEIIKNNLKNNILYLDLTNENIDIATEKLQIEAKFPYIVVYTNGIITDTYNIAKTNYDTKKTMTYLNRIGVTEYD